MMLSSIYSSKGLRTTARASANASEVSSTGWLRSPGRLPDMRARTGSILRACFHRFNLNQDGLIAFVDFFLFAEQFERQGEFSAKLFALAEQVLRLPQTFELRPNYPNPFNPETTLPYVLAVDSPVWLTIYDTAGQQVRQPRISG